MENRDVLQIQANEDGTFTWCIPELEAKGTCEQASEALEEAIDLIVDNPTVSKITQADEAKVAAIGKRIAALRVELSNLEREQEDLKQIIPVVAHELLEEFPMVEKYVRWLFIDHPIEEFLGNVKTVGFFPQKDRDGDGDIDVAPSLCSYRAIKFL